MLRINLKLKTFARFIQSVEVSMAGTKWGQYATERASPSGNGITWSASETLKNL